MTRTSYSYAWPPPAQRAGGRYGKRTATRPHGVSDLSVYGMGKFPEPPARVDAPAVSPWGMLLNDTLGDCVIAGIAHAIMASNAQVGESDPVPDDEAVKDQYFAITQGADAGCNEADVLRLWRTSGLFGNNQLAAYAPVSPGNLRDFHVAIADYGGCLLGVQMPTSAQAQFRSGSPWTVVPNDPIEGGHCVLAVGYDDAYVSVVTWGAVQKVSYRWLDVYQDEGWCLLSKAVVEAGHGPGEQLDIASLRSDLDQIQADAA